jgi:hypothetical protein
VMGDLPRKNNDGLIVMGDLPKGMMMVSLWWVTYLNEEWKVYEVVSLLWVTYPKEKKSGLIIMGDLPRWKMKSGLIVMGDLPRKRWWSHCDGWPTQRKMVVSL